MGEGRYLVPLMGLAGVVSAEYFMPNGNLHGLERPATVLFEFGTSALVGTAMTLVGEELRRIVGHFPRSNDLDKKIMYGLPAASYGFGGLLWGLERLFS